jgi:hypothetical protein
MGEAVIWLLTWFVPRRLHNPGFPSLLLQINLTEHSVPSKSRTHNKADRIKVIVNEPEGKRLTGLSLFMDRSGSRASAHSSQESRMAMPRRLWLTRTDQPRI